MWSSLLARVTSLVLVFWSVLVGLGRAPDADDPPYETEGCGLQRNTLLRLRSGRTDDTGSLQYAPHSWIRGRVSFNCISQCTIYPFVSRSQSCGPRRVALNSYPTCLAVSLLSLLTSSQVSPPRATFADAPSFEVCPAKVGPRNFVFHQHFSKGARPLQASPFRLECRMHCRHHLETAGQLAFRVFGPRPISPTHEFSCRSLRVS